MGYSVYENSGRWAGYGITAYCEHPDCNEKIDRGMSFACGGEPFSEYGCELYFCEKHREYTCFKLDGDGVCDHEEDCDCACVPVCASCSGKDKEYPHGYPRKDEHPEWVYHLLNHYSWAEWRKNNPKKVEELKKLPATMPEHWNNEPD